MALRLRVSRLREVRRRITHGMAFQVRGSEVKDASASVVRAVICFLSFVEGSSGSLAKSDQTDVGLSSALPLVWLLLGPPKAAPPPWPALR
jgi:hypothetical protein